MKTAMYTRYGTPEVLELADAAMPTPKDGEILVKVRASTVTPVDIAFREGTGFARLFTGIRKPKNRVLGTELAGDVVAVGENVTRFRRGDRVFASPLDGAGAHAQFICLREDGAVAPMPSNMSYEEAATICNGALTALAFLRDTGAIKAGQKVLINGASGSIGTYAVQLAKYYGAEVTGVCSTRNVALVKSLGADRVIDYTAESFASSGERYDIIFDTVGKSSFSASKRALKADGVYLTPVLSTGALISMLWTALRRKKVKFTATGLRPQADQANDMRFIKTLIEDGELRTVIDRSYPLEQIAAAHAYVAKGHKTGNVVVTIAHPEHQERERGGALAA